VAFPGGGSLPGIAMRFLGLSCASMLLALATLSLVGLVGCGRTDLADELLVDGGGPDVTRTPDATGFDVTPFDGPIGFDVTPFDGPIGFDVNPLDAPFDSSTCGDGRCDNGETCASCPLDCGFCPKCGDGTCNPGETCSNCPQDCGSCAMCGDGYCNGGENCISCPQDCGVCQSCGDGQCTGTENCTNCPQDCGKCPGCGDGKCSGTETCVSCPQDCGSCAVCGNGVCNDGETCVNCPQDCGACALKDCQQALLCAFGCFQGGVQNINLTCITDCDAEGCPSSQVFLNDAVNCAIQSFFNGTCSIGGGGGGGLGCIEQACAAQIAACFAEPPCGTQPP